MANKTYLHLNDEQRFSFFQQTGLHVARIAVDKIRKCGVAVDRSCRSCLLHEGLPNVVIESNGSCNYCNKFRLDDHNGAYSERRAAELITELKGSNEIDSIVAYSGGKDSAAALITAVEKYHLRPLAVLVDNDFVPDRVKSAAAQFCARQGVPFEIRHTVIAPLAARLYRDGFRELPCPSCIRTIFQQVRMAAEENQTRLVVGGHRFPPPTFPLGRGRAHGEQSETVCVSPLLALRRTESDQLNMIEAAGWCDPKIPGNTSNCALIGFMEQIYFDRQGHNPHIYEVSKEIRAGFYSREIGMEKITRPQISKTEHDFVLERLALGDNHGEVDNCR